ncbi:hypothetical protein BDV96DRAFT_32763 [Lophiotrema nucula]|uniref:Zn(2)-C6 fungal-type domain-containing protein n=1 Tax=Lophiotrema nucula TaxID=690887 RepID=A0A6A5ZBT9_9PLEO|nr:hypothetical protein BDV96DRAFT_32763 [Lophiotrema nucula]
MAIGVERRASKAASRLDQSLLLHTLESNAMSYIPLAHPSGVGLPVADISSNHSAEGRLHFDTTIAKPEVPPSLVQQSGKKRRPSKAKTPTEIRRSSSTPHMRNLALANSGELSPTGDKRRNKLGYHRTSVACGHCRRRKIRCLVAPDDTQGRCANCIRLKKECNFYPVEQSPETQRSQTSSVKETATGAPASSTTSSPHHPPSALGEKPEEFRSPYPAVSGSTAAPRYGMSTDAEVEPKQPGSVHMQHPPYAYPHAIETQWPPAGILPSSTVAENSPSSSGYWRPSPSTATSNYGSESNFSGGHTPGTMSSASNPPYSGHHEGHGWPQPTFQPPTRSMSYGNIEGLPHHYSNSGLGIQSQEYQRRPSPYSYPPNLETNHATAHATTMGDASSAPLSAPIVPNQQFNYPPNWSPYGTVQHPNHEMPAPTRSMSAQWYSDHPPLDQVQEEGIPPMAYNVPGLPQYYSGA